MKTIIEWIKILKHEDKPNYYSGVIIFADGKIHYDWHRLNDVDNEFYGSLNTDLIIEGSKVTHWAPLLKPPANNTTWISAEERLSDESELVFVFFDYGDKQTIEIDECSKVFKPNFVTHWLPLQYPLNR